jgi:hypothetical protein
MFSSRPSFHVPLRFQFLGLYIDLVSLYPSCITHESTASVLCTRLNVLHFQCIRYIQLCSAKFALLLGGRASFTCFAIYEVRTLSEGPQRGLGTRICARGPVFSCSDVMGPTWGRSTETIGVITIVRFISQCYLIYQPHRFLPSPGTQRDARNMKRELILELEAVRVRLQTSTLSLHLQLRIQSGAWKRMRLTLLDLNPIWYGQRSELPERHGTSFAISLDRVC